MIPARAGSNTRISIPTGILYICHGRKSNLVEFQILPVESLIGVSTGRNSNQGDLGIALGSEI